MFAMLNGDIVKALLFPIFIYLAKKIIDWFMNIHMSPKPARRARFERVPIHSKEEFLGKVNELIASDDIKDKRRIDNINLQMKFLYEQMGIYMPLWHAHQLISCMAGKDISSLDVRLRGFLNNTLIGIYRHNGFSINDKAIRMTYAIHILFGLVSISAFIYAGMDSARAFLADGAKGLFLLFSFVYFCLILGVISFVINQIEETRQGVKFARLFKTWINDHTGHASNTGGVLDTETPGQTSF